MPEKNKADSIGTDMRKNGDVNEFNKMRKGMMVIALALMTFFGICLGIDLLDTPKKIDDITGVACIIVVCLVLGFLLGRLSSRGK